MSKSEIIYSEVKSLAKAGKKFTAEDVAKGVNMTASEVSSMLSLIASAGLTQIVGKKNGRTSIYGAELMSLPDYRLAAPSIWRKQVRRQTNKRRGRRGAETQKARGSVDPFAVLMDAVNAMIDALAKVEPEVKQLRDLREQITKLGLKK